MIPLYCARSAAAAFRFARRHAATSGQYLMPPPAAMEVEPERMADNLRRMGDMFLLVTWKKVRFPVYAEGSEESNGEQWGTIYKVWSVYQASDS